MKRPLLAIGCSYLIAAAVCICGELLLCLAVFFICLSAAFILFLKKAGPGPRYFAAGGALAAVVCAVFLLLEISPARALAGQKVSVTGQICELSSAHRAVVLTDTVDGTPRRVRFDVFFYGEEGLSPADRVKGDFILQDASAGKSLFRRAYDRSRRVFLRGTASGAVSVSPPDSLTAFQRVQGWREELSFHIRRLLPRYQGEMTAAMALGRKDLVNESLQLAFRGAGLSHLLVVSGLHLSFLCLLARRVFLRLIPHRRVAVGCTILFAAGAMLMMGAGPSVLRAGWMTVLCLAGELLGRRADPLNSLGFALLMVALPNPFAAAGVGLWLSAASTFSILAFSPRLEEPLHRRCEKLPLPGVWKFFASAASVSLCAYLFTLPISALVFGEVSLAAPPANLLAAPLAPLAVVGSFLTALTAPVGFLAPLARGAALFTGLVQSALAGIARGFSSLPMASLSVPAGYLSLWCAGVAALGTLALRRGGRRAAAAFLSLSVITLSAGNISYRLATRDMLFIDCVGGGRETTVAAVQNGRAVVAGELSDPEAVLDALRQRGARTLDLLILLPSSRDVPSPEPLIRAYPPAAVLAPEGRAEGLDALPLAPCSVSLWEDGRVTVDGGGSVLLEAGQIKTLILPDDCGILDDMQTFHLLAVGRRPAAAPKTGYLVSAGVLYAEDAPRAETAAFLLEGAEPVSFRGRDGMLIPG
jgi:competence protein ComEC